MQCEVKIGFKVVEASGNGLPENPYRYHSCIIPPEVPGHKEYPIGVRVYPEEFCGPLCVFVDKDSAVKFLRTNFMGEPTDCRVFRIKYERAITDMAWTSIPQSNPLWDEFGDPVCISEWCEGAESASWVELVEDVTDHWGNE